MIITPTVLRITCGIMLVATAQADVSNWLDEVNTGTSTFYLNAAVPTPINVDIGVPTAGTGLTYEFIVNASNTGTSALIGSRNTGVGSSSGIKFEQYFNSQAYGVTQFGVADHSFIGSNNPDEDVHLVFQSDPLAGTTELFVNGVSQGTVPHAVELEGMVGLGQAHDPAADFDVLTSTLLGVVIYEGALPPAEIQSHSDAFHSTTGVGPTFCDPADSNSTGVPTELLGTLGSTVGSGLHLEVSSGPPGEFGILLIGTGVSDPGFLISNGHLCLANSGIHQFATYSVAGNQNSIGQFDAFGLLQNLVGTSTTGSGFDVPSMIPTMGGSITAGETWHFQSWHRDTLAGVGSSNFSNGLSVTF